MSEPVSPVTNVMPIHAAEISKRRHNAIDTQMSTGIGREFIAIFLEDHHWGENPFVANHGQLSYNVGCQQAASDLYRMVQERQPEQAAMMLAEWRERQDNLSEENGNG